MYSSLFRFLPGPTWFQVFQAALIAGFFLVFLFEVGYPWLAQNVPMFDNTVDA